MTRTWIAMALCALPFASFSDELAESCTACHKDALTLEHWQTAPLAARLIEMREGRVDHIVPIPKLTDEQLRTLAAALAGQ